MQQENVFYQNSNQTNKHPSVKVVFHSTDEGNSFNTKALK